MKNIALILIFSSIFLASCATTNKQSVHREQMAKSNNSQQDRVAVQKRTKQAWKYIKSGAIVVDVRTQEEFTEGHLDRAINIPYDKIREKISLFGEDKEKVIVLYCRSGRRSSIAKNVLELSGFENVFNAGGMEDLKVAE